MEGAAAAASRKRKICHDHHDDDVEDDEQKMEKFYDLIRNIREARESLMNGSDATKGLQNKKKKKKAGEDHHHHQEQTNIQVWTPSFEREDFMEESRREAQFKTVHAGSSEREAGAWKENDKEEEEERLDLKLSL